MSTITQQILDNFLVLWNSLFSVSKPFMYRSGNMYMYLRTLSCLSASLEILLTSKQRLSFVKMFKFKGCRFLTSIFIGFKPFLYEDFISYVWDNMASLARGITYSLQALMC